MSWWLMLMPEVCGKQNERTELGGLEQRKQQEQPARTRHSDAAFRALLQPVSGIILAAPGKNPPYSSTPPGLLPKENGDIEPAWATSFRLRKVTKWLGEGFVCGIIVKENKHGHQHIVRGLRHQRNLGVMDRHCHCDRLHTIENKHHKQLAAWMSNRSSDRNNNVPLALASCYKLRTSRKKDSPSTYYLL